MIRFRNAALICFCTAVLLLVIAAAAWSGDFAERAASLGASFWVVGFGLTVCVVFFRARDRAL